MGQYLGLVELVFTALVVGAFGIWQLRSLNRDIAARKARERAEAAEADARANDAGARDRETDSADDTESGKVAPGETRSTRAD